MPDSLFSGLRRLSVLALSLILVGCVGGRTSIRPNPREVEIIMGNKCPPASYSEKTTVIVHGDFSDPAMDEIGREFFKILHDSNIFDALYIAERAPEEVQFELIAEFDVDYDLNLNAERMNIILTGCCLFLPAPFIWYDQNLKIMAKVDIYSDNKKIGTVNAQSDAEISYQTFSRRKMYGMYGLRSRAFNSAKSSVFGQLMGEVGRFCNDI